MPTLPEHLSSCVVFDRLLFVIWSFFPFGHCIVCPSWTYGFCYSFIIYKLFLSGIHITKVMTSNRSVGEVYSIQYYVIQFVSDLGQVGGFFRVSRFLPSIKVTATIQSCPLQLNHRDSPNLQLKKYVVMSV